MVKWGLKTSIALNLAFLLFFGMLMLDWIFITLARQALLDDEIRRGEQFLAILDSPLLSLPKEMAPSSFAHGVQSLEALAKHLGISALLIQNPSAETIQIGDAGAVAASLTALARQARSNSTPRVTYEEAHWGLLYRTHRRMFLSRGIERGAQEVWGAALAVDLGPFNARLKRIQSFLLIYIFLNGLLLTLFGLHRLGRMTIKPLTNLVRRAETYQDDGQGFFLPTPRNNDFDILSNALNRMLTRIDGDRERLNASVESLEAANQDLRQAQRNVIRAEKMASVGRLSAGIAHEIGNPMGIVLGYLELLKHQDLSDAERADCLARAEAEIGRMDAIIRQLLDFARPAHSELAPLAVHDVLREVAEVFQLQPLTAEIPLALELKARFDGIRGNSAQLRQVFLNLMLNARDAVAARESGPPGELRIRTENPLPQSADQSAAADTLIVEFRDNGAGIDPGQLETIFDPFVTTKAPGRGTGLGLSVSFTIIHDLGGTIEARNIETGGTCLTVRLPLHPEPST